MYTIIVKYYSDGDKEIFIKEIEAPDLISAIEHTLEQRSYAVTVLSASYKDECAVIKDSINEE